MSGKTEQKQGIRLTVHSARQEYDCRRTSDATIGRADNAPSPENNRT
jgi:hypothetical protein